MSYTRLRYHLVLGTYRNRKYIRRSAEDALYECLEEAVEDRGGVAVAIGGMPDHVHLVVAIPPVVSVSEFVKEVKRQTSIAADGIEELPDEFRWQRGYGAFTVSRWEMDGIIRYVQNQKAHHGSPG